MQALFRLSHRARRLIAPALCLLLAFYFGYHAVRGERGLIAFTHTATEIKRMEAQLDAIRAERSRLAERVALLHPDHVDPDMLDEQMRRILGLAHRDELIVFAN